jgi:adenylosuccinate lyase
MPSLGDVEPPIALGALDGRYRAAVAPLVDHLSEAALNRERVRVEIEWLIHLTSYAVVPGTRALTGTEHEALRAIVTNFGAAEIAALADIERSDCPRRQGRRILPQGTARRHRPRPGRRRARRA